MLHLDLVQATTAYAQFSVPASTSPWTIIGQISNRKPIPAPARDVWGLWWDMDFSAIFVALGYSRSLEDSTIQHSLANPATIQLLFTFLPKLDFGTPGQHSLNLGFEANWDWRPSSASSFIAHTAPSILAVSSGPPNLRISNLVLPWGASSFTYGKVANYLPRFDIHITPASKASAPGSAWTGSDCKNFRPTAPLLVASSSTGLQGIADASLTWDGTSWGRRPDACPFSPPTSGRAGAARLNCSSAVSKNAGGVASRICVREGTGFVVTIEFIIKQLAFAAGYHIAQNSIALALNQLLTVRFRLTD